MKTFKFTISGERYEARVVEYSQTFAKVNINGTDYEIQIEEERLRARLEGAPIARIGKEIKAVTYHTMKIQQRADGLKVNIVFDV